jgi:hypothetical protein
MAEQKTKESHQSVDDFLSSLDEQVKKDCSQLILMMSKATGNEPRLWSGNIVGFGKYHYKYDSGHEGYSCLTGFSPRKDKISLYLMPGYSEGNTKLDKLGKFKAAKGCLYIKRLADVNQKVLMDLISGSVKVLRDRYPANAQ